MKVSLCLFLCFSILWKGGKALDATWLLALFASFMTFAEFLLLKEKQQPKSSILLFGSSFLFLGWTILSFYYSTTKNYGLDELMQTASFVLLFNIMLSLPADRVFAYQKILVRCISISTLLACGIGIAVYILQPIDRFVGTFFDFRFHTDYWPNAWAEFLLLAWPIVLFAITARSSEDANKAPFPNSMLQSMIAGLLFACLALSYSRGALLAFALQIFLLITVLFLRYRNICSLQAIVVRGSLSVLFAAIFFFWINSVRSQYFPVQSVVSKVTFQASEGTSSISERQEFWNAAIQSTLRKPLFGFGPYSFRFIQPQTQQAVLATSDHPHNVLLKLSMERGLVAALLFVLIITLGFWQGIRKMYTDSNDHQSFLMALCMISIIGVLAHNVIDYNLQFVGISLPFWLIVGLLANSSREKRSVILTGIYKKLFVFSLVFLALALSIVACFEGRLLFLSSRARAAEIAHQPNVALSWYEKTDDALFPRDAWLSRAAIHMQSGSLVQAQEALSESEALNAEDARHWKLEGKLFLASRNDTKAKDAFEQAYKFGRYNDLEITRLLVQTLQKVDPKNFETRRHEFEILMNEFGLAIQQNTHFIALNRNVEELEQLCQLFAAAYPREKELYLELARKSAEHAALERSRLSARARGFFW